MKCSVLLQAALLWKVLHGVESFQRFSSTKTMRCFYHTARWGQNKEEPNYETMSVAAERLESKLADLDLILQNQSQGEISKTDGSGNFLDPHQQNMATLSRVTIVALGSFAVTAGIENLLVDNEWLQAWRYFWPLVGALYMVDGLWLTDTDGKGGILPFDVNTNKVKRFLAVVLGFGLVVGGAYDAFMPVWDTGPNVITQAGIGQDSALALALLSVTSISVSSKDGRTQDDSTTLLQIVLLGQLGALADGSIDELLGRISDTI